MPAYSSKKCSRWWLDDSQMIRRGQPNSGSTIKIEVWFGCDLDSSSFRFLLSLPGVCSVSIVHTGSPCYCRCQMLHPLWEPLSKWEKGGSLAGYVSDPQNLKQLLQSRGLSLFLHLEHLLEWSACTLLRKLSFADSLTSARRQKTCKVQRTHDSREHTWTLQTHTHARAWLIFL